MTKPRGVGLHSEVRAGPEAQGVAGAVAKMTGQRYSWSRILSPCVYCLHLDKAEIVICRNPDLDRWVAYCTAPQRHGTLTAKSAGEARLLAEAWIDLNAPANPPSAGYGVTPPAGSAR